MRTLSLILLAFASLAHAAPETIILVYDGDARDVTCRTNTWKTADGAFVGGPKARLTANVTAGPGDFRVRARLRIENQKNSAASFFLGKSHFGFEGAQGTVFASGPLFGKLHLLKPSPEVFERGAWIDFDVIRKGKTIAFLINDKPVHEVKTDLGSLGHIGFTLTRSTMRGKKVAGEPARAPANAPQ